MANPFVHEIGEGGFASAGTNPEKGYALPWGLNAAASWMDYSIWIEVILDPGLALHKPLPQYNTPADTLAVIGVQDPNADIAIPAQGSGVNLVSQSQSVDVVQRMASPTYHFVLSGFAVRAGWQIPIPGLVSIGGVPCVPIY